MNSPKTVPSPWAVPMCRLHRVRVLIAPLALVGGMFAQTAPTPPKLPPRAEVAAPGAGKARDDVVELSAFEVKADSDRSYGALNSNSITRFNTDLDRMPVSADIFNEA